MQNNIISILDTVILKNTVQEYLLALILFVVLFILLRIFRNIFIKKIKILTQKTENKFDDLIVEIFAGISKFFYWFLAFYLAIKSLIIPEFLDKIIFYVFTIFVVFEIISIIKKIIRYFSNIFIQKIDVEKKSIFKIGETILIWVIYVIAFLILLSSFGVDITAIVAGLGVGGIAIAFALKEILADLFSYFTILLDKPVEEGDFITLGNKVGTVQKIGIKTTRLLGLDGREIIVSNNMISSVVIDNSRKIEYRRILFDFHVTYDTSIEKLKKLKAGLIKIIEKDEKTELLRVFLNTFGDSALIFRVDYKTFAEDYHQHTQVKERINFAILELCEKENINIAYPTMTIHSK